MAAGRTERFEISEARERTMRKPRLLGVGRCITMAAGAIHGYGALTGSVTITPVCPVERQGVACRPSAEMFAAHPISIYRMDRRTLVKAVTPDAYGRFAATLPAGDYWIDADHQVGGAIGGVSGVPKTVHITANTVARVSIAVDTGLR